MNILYIFFSYILFSKETTTKTSQTSSVSVSVSFPSRPSPHIQSTLQTQPLRTSFVVCVHMIHTWYCAQTPRGYHRRPSYHHGMKRGGTPGRVRGAPRCSYQQKQQQQMGDRNRAENKGDGDKHLLSERELSKRKQGLRGPAVSGGAGAIVVPGLLEDPRVSGPVGASRPVGGRAVCAVPVGDGGGGGVLLLLSLQHGWC